MLLEPDREFGGVRGVFTVDCRGKSRVEEQSLCRLEKRRFFQAKETNFIELKKEAALIFPAYKRDCVDCV